MKTDQTFLPEEAEETETMSGGGESAGRAGGPALTEPEGGAGDRDAAGAMRRLFHPSDEAMLEIYMGGGYY